MPSFITTYEYDRVVKVLNTATADNLGAFVVAQLVVDEIDLDESAVPYCSLSSDLHLNYIELVKKGCNLSYLLEHSHHHALHICNGSAAPTYTVCTLVISQRLAAPSSPQSCRSPSSPPQAD
jgi:hypothetical protein